MGRRLTIGSRFGLLRSVLTALVDKLRVLAHRTIASPRRADERPSIRNLRNIAEMANELLGRPACSAEELAARRAPPPGAAAPMAAAPAPVPAPTTRPLQAPVRIYFDGKDHRTKAKVEELLHARGVDFQVLDVTDDEAERSWVTTAAHSNEFPIVVIAGVPVGGLSELTQLDLTGELAQRVFGAGSRREP
ncbi:MAG TPA: glutaredoxin [Polyangia bacterium]|nr:glutaredoxin [Polyangia bacterium]